MNLRAIDVGMGSTGGSVQLRHHSAPSQPATATPVPGGGTANPPAAGQPPSTATPSSSAVPPMQPPTTTPDTAATSAVAFDPAVATAAAGSTFAVNIVARNATDVSSIPLQITYDASKVQLVNVSSGSFLSRDGQVVVLTHREDESTGTAQMTASRPSTAPGISGDGPVFTLTFLAKAPGQSSLVISRTAAKNAAGQPIPLAGSQATVNVR
jgi:general secretion pathway protein D